MSEEKRVMMQTEGAGNVALMGLTPEEHIGFRGVLNGHHWVRVVDGRMEFKLTRNPVPEPMPDDNLLPFWRTSPPFSSKTLKTTALNPGEHSAFPAFYLQDLCPYDHDRDQYPEQAAKLESYGFECLRSRRDSEGLFREVWILPGAYAARGDLQAAIAGKTLGENQSEAIRSYIMTHVRFGTIENTAHRWGVGPPE